MNKILFKDFISLPNLLSFFRILLIVPIFFLITNPTEFNNYVLVILVLIGIFSDFLDGYLSRKLNMVTDLGIIIDPLADKISMGVVLALLTVYRGFPLTLVAAQLCL